MSDRRQDLIGRRYGRGTVARLLGKNKWHCFEWELKCDCGGIYRATTGNLNAGHVASCGCYSKERVIENAKKATEATKLPPGHAARNELYQSYKKRALKMGLPFELTKDQFFTLTKRHCSYCGQEPRTIFKGRTSVYTYNGLDRTNPSEGYTLDNITSCCKRCNQAKNDMSETEFIDWIGRVYKWSVETYLEEVRDVA